MPHCLLPERDTAAAWSGEKASWKWGKKGFTLMTVQCGMLQKSGFGFVQGFHTHSSDGVCGHTHRPTHCMGPAAQEQPLAGCCNSCSTSLATHITNVLHKRKDGLLNIGEMGENTSVHFIFSSKMLSFSD